MLQLIIVTAAHGYEVNLWVKKEIKKTYLVEFFLFPGKLGR